MAPAVSFGSQESELFHLVNLSELVYQQFFFVFLINTANGSLISPFFSFSCTFKRSGSFFPLNTDDNCVSQIC